ncbi:hypothetical protein FGADI_12118 [Fusarium gaditjirri]|uniref:Uncharacterized protein n=1 Tax=Fusarium gaditjirri TaxID=282569 RepID=A0A8H4SSW1_9HYPO|nr:hypothetical protein FGADI_12118 [Fusarium gaditjirri]
MDKINGLAGTVPLEILVDALADPDVPMSVALTALESMRDTAQHCYNSAMLAQTDMIDWSGMCMELEEACVADGASTETRHQKAALNLTRRRCQREEISDDVQTDDRVHSQGKPKDGEAETASKEAPPASKDGSTPASYGTYDLSGKFYPDDTATIMCPEMVDNDYHYTGGEDMGSMVQN